MGKPKQHGLYWGTRTANAPRAGHILDLAFSNIPFATITVRDDMHSGSDHSTLVTIIAARGTPSLDQFHYRVPEVHLHKFAGLAELNIQGMPLPSLGQDSAQLDDCVSALSTALTNAIETAGKPERETGHSAPWWSKECSKAYHCHLRSRSTQGQPPSDATKESLTEVRNAKRAYWRDRIDGIQDDKALYKLVGWHKLTPNQQDTLLIVGGRVGNKPAKPA
jgi:hypothetical protein